MDDDLVYLAITRLQHAYADVATRRAWEEMRALALPDATFDFELPTGQALHLVGPEALGEFGRQATDSFSFYTYVPLNTVVSVTDEGHATGRFRSLELAVDGGSGDWLEFYGLYDDAYVRHEGRWRFQRRSFTTVATRRSQ
jgi:hypothetical protein